MYNYTGDLDPDGTPSAGREWVDNRFHTYRPEELVRFALSKPARFEPGTDQSYSNTNYTLALLLIEKLTGHSYAEQAQRRILGPLGLSDTVVSATSPELPGPHAHGYYRYQDAGEWKVVDVSRQNPSLPAGAGDLISTAKDLGTFVSALLGGKLLPAALPAEMRTPHGRFGLGLGLWVQDLGPDGGTIVHHNGGAPGGYGALVISTPDGGKTLTASLTTGDVAPAEVFPVALDGLVEAVFRDGQAGPADKGGRAGSAHGLNTRDHALRGDSFRPCPGQSANRATPSPPNSAWPVHLRERRAEQAQPVDDPLGHEVGRHVSCPTGRT